MDNQKKAYLYAIPAVVFWSTVATAFKIALSSINFFQLLFYSSFIATVALFAIILFQGKFYLLKKLTLKDYLRYLVTGFFNPFLYYLVLFKAYSILPAQIAQPLNFTWPIMLVLLSIIFLKQKISLKSIVAIFISFFGVVIISLQGNISSWHIDNAFGVFLALGSSIIWAFYWIVNIKDKNDEAIKLFVSFGFGFVFIFIANILFSKIIIPDLPALSASIYSGLFEMGITFFLWMKALQISKSNAKICNLVYLCPFVSLIFIHFIVGETIYYTTFVGLVFIVSGILIQNFLDKK
ncbi:MAG: EamA family transporter [Bacteroidales bacterium]|nr:EamA family transporter [Bacteroidales bacterium]